MNVTCRAFRTAVWVRRALLIATAALFLGVFNGAAISEPVWKDGELLIYTSEDLKVMADWVNGSQASADIKYCLMGDIDLGGIDVPWLPIGVNIDISFNGEFIGGGHAIRNFVISRDANFVGLFGYVSVDSQISDLKVVSFDVRGKHYVGGLVGYNNRSTIVTSYTNGSVSGTGEGVGGLVGYNNRSTIITSYANGSVSGKEYVGGLVGYNYGGAISTSYASGSVSGTDNVVGGLVGWNSGTINTSYASGVVKGNSSVGGLIGWNEGAINASYASGMVSGTGNVVGGLVAYNYEGTISTSYSNGAVNGNRSVGGLIGWNEGTIITSHASGAVSGNQNIGGLVGYSNGGAINISYARGTVCGDEHVGGLIGYNNKGAIITSYASGAVSGTGRSGGLAGSNYGQIIASYASGAVNGNWLIGGLVGGNYGGIISTSYASGTVKGTYNIGGLIGCNDGGIISTSYASGSISGDQRIGGLVGYNYMGTISASYASGPVNGTKEDVGGLVGGNYGQIINNYASGAVKGTNNVGGLVGKNSGGIISTSYASGTIIGRKDVGGLVGWNDIIGTISTSYASGTVSGDESVGGFVGCNFGTINPSYWLQDADTIIKINLPSIGHDNNVISTDVTSLDLAGMTNRNSFNAFSWDFFGDPGTSPDWCYTSFDQGAAPALLAFFDPASAPNINRINRDFINIIPQSVELRTGEIKKLQLSAPSFKNLAVQGFNLSTPDLSGDKIIIETPEMYKAVLTIDEHGVIIVSADSTFFRNSNIENLTISVDHKIGGYPQLQKSFSLLIVPDSTINPR